MKIHLPLLLALTLPAFVLDAAASQYIPPGATNIGSWTVVDTTEPLDVVTFYSNGQFIVTPQNSSKVLASGVYLQSGSGVTLTISGVPSSGFGPKTASPADTSYSGSGDFSFLEQIIDANGETPALASNGKPIVPSGPLTVGGTSNFSATVTDNGNSISIFSNSSATFDRLLNGSGGQIILGLPSSTGGSGNNTGNGTGNPSGPPGGGTGDPSATPEPSTWALLICSLAGLLYFRRYRFGRQ